MDNNNRFVGFLSVTDVAQILGISRSTTLTLIRGGQITSIRVGAQIRIPETGLAQYLQEAGLENTQIYRGGLKPTTARATPATDPTPTTEARRAAGVNVR